MPRLTFARAVVYCIGVAPLAGQSLSLTGRLACLGQVEVGHSRLIATDRNPVIDAVIPAEQSGDVTLQFVIRTNCPFAIVASIDGAAGDRELRLTPETIQPHSGAELLMPNALNVQAFSANLGDPSPVVILTGPRVSRRGSNTSAGNAIVVVFRVAGRVAPSGAVVRFRLQFPSASARSDAVS